jgi:phage repressor protein C with HTH and peptisase S24 domain
MYLQANSKEDCKAGLQADLYSRRMSGIGERIRKRREELGWSQPQLAKKIGGITYQAIQAIEKGGNTKHLNGIARALGVNPDWLETGEGSRDPLSTGKPADFIDNPRPEAPALPRTDLMPRNLPVFGSAACGDDGEFEFNTGEVIDYVKRPPRLEGIKEAYALYLVGSSMIPWRKQGQLVYVHPGQPPQIEDHVVVQFKPEQQGEAPRAMVKLLMKRNAKEIVLRQYNPESSRTFKMDKVHSIHRVVDWDELLGI